MVTPFHYHHLMDELAEGYWRIVEPVWEVIDMYQGEKVFLETYAQADPIAGLLYAAHWAEFEICNAGSRQFFGNSTGIMARKRSQECV